MTNQQKNILAFAATILVFLLIALAVYNKKSSEIKYTRPLMGTIVELTLAGKDEARLNAAAEAAFDEIKRLEELMSHYRGDSDVAKINKAAGKEAVIISRETMDVIEASLKASHITNGAFDVTMGVLGKVWLTKDDRGEMTIPSREEVETLLPLIDYHQITIDKKNNKVKLAKKGMKINLGGIAKGYIVGKAADVLKRHGIKKGIVHA
ncbi:MAG: FAD:protein FMN transferase, partial [Deltaproteobacteria bacterium]|nr:FAD:protein FMN transferase [Deltaproteobacteria bacterium]